MVYGVVKSIQKAIKYRGGVWGLLEHMYTNGDFPPKFGTYMGSDSAGNRYYENRVDYPFGQHRWIEPGDIHNYDASQIQPEWHLWMTHMNDVPPCASETFLSEHGSSKIQPMCRSDAPGGTDHGDSMVGYTEKGEYFHGMVNLSQVRSRGYGIGNHVVGLPPGVKDSFYTQPGSPYNESSSRPLVMEGCLDEDGGRAYKNDKWAERLTTDAEREKVEREKAEVAKEIGGKIMTRKEMAMQNRAGGTAW